MVRFSRRVSIMVCGVTSDPGGFVGFVVKSCSSSFDLANYLKLVLD